MDDFVISNLHESRNEWCTRLVTILTPLLVEGMRSMYKEALQLCVANNEVEKYLLTFQNLLCRVPKWNSVVVEDERKRISERSGCNYLEDLITCVHIIQLKVLTCIRVGNKQKKIDISIPKLDHFLHKTYINVARKVFCNVYLFERNITPMQTQKNNRELELIVQDCILATIRESIPTEAIIRAYMEESVEHEEEVTVEAIPDADSGTSAGTNDGADLDTGEGTNAGTDAGTHAGTGADSGDLDGTGTGEERESNNSDDDEIVPIVPSIVNADQNEVVTRLKFNDYDDAIDENNVTERIEAPKTIERLEEISASRALQARMDADEEDEDNDRIKIHADTLDANSLGFLDLDTSGDTISNNAFSTKSKDSDSLLIDDILEIL